MPNWKDRVTAKITKQPDSTSSEPSSPTAASSNPQKARSQAKDGGYFSSVFTYIYPPNESGSKKHESHHNLKSMRSLPIGWISKATWKHKPSKTNNECEESKPHEQKDIKCDTREEDNGEQQSTSCSEKAEDAPTPEPNSPVPAVMDLNIDSLFISQELYRFLQSSLPNIVKGCRWVLMYSTLRHGISLRTLIRKSSDLSGPCLLITGDSKGAVFGALLRCPLTPTPKRKYQGTHETFVFTTLYGEPRLFRPTGANRYFYMCVNELIGFGGGGSFALSLDEDLLTGTSGRCDTFGNECLAHDETFDLKNVELWGFAHSSRCP